MSAIMRFFFKGSGGVLDPYCNQLKESESSLQEKEKREARLKQIRGLRKSGKKTRS